MTDQTTQPPVREGDASPVSRKKAQAPKRKRKTPKKVDVSKKKAATSKKKVRAEDPPESGRDRLVILFRHGIAEEPDGIKPDEERKLTAEGHERMNEISRGLELLVPRVDAIYTSPLRRAVQTSEWLAKRYKRKLGPKTLDFLAPGSDPAAVISFLEQSTERRIVLVGHEPHLSTTIKTLLNLPAGARLELRKGGCCAVRIGTDDTTSLEWIVIPRVLRRLAGD